MRKLGILLLMVLLIAGCRFPGTPMGAGAPEPTTALSTPQAIALSGRVVFPVLTTQTTLVEVAVASTVSLINAATNQTVATTLTDGSGAFRMTFPGGFVPAPAALYYLEAVKGLETNQPGYIAARVRTIVKFQSGWVSLSNAIPNAGVVINQSTTALAIGAALLNANTPFDFASLIGSVSGATYTPVPGLTTVDFNSLSGLVAAILAADMDPVAGIGLQLPNTWIRLNQSLSLTSISSATGSVGTPVTLTGRGFDPVAANNLVKFNGVAATLTSASAMSLELTVPSGATSGQVTLQVGNLIVLGPIFTVDVAVSGLTPSSGGSGTTVTITGSGFGATPGDIVVRFNGVIATLLTATPTSLTVRAPVSSTGPISVTVSGMTGTSSGPFTYVPMLTALYEPVMNAGRLRLEGSFGPSVTVNLPGGGSVAATLLGPNRAEVIVPAGTTAGALTVTTAGSTTNALPFRRTSYTPGLQQFSNTYDQTTSPRASSSLMVPSSAQTSVVIGNYLYVIGGNNGSFLNRVERATINADGTLGSFANAGVTLMTARYNCTSAVIGSYLYVIGGNSGGGYLNSVERATINADGTIGPFVNVSGVTLTTARYGHTSAVIGSFLYVIGGYGGSYLNSVERATINADGTIGPFVTVSGATMATARMGHTSVVIGNYLYVIGGTNGSFLNSVERAVINPDGTIGAFLGGGSLPGVRSFHTSAVIGDYLYLIGGYNGTSPVISVDRAPIAADGSVGAFANLPGVTLPTARYNCTSAVIGNHLYVIGGYNGSYLNSLERAIIDADGSISPFSTVAALTLATGRYGHTSTVIGNYLYVVGGYNGAYSNGLERAVINSDGTIGAFSAVPGVTLVTARMGHTSAVIGNYLYVIGGDGGSSLTSVERATINADGTLSTFTTAAGVSLATARNYPSSAVIGNYLYVIGGTNGTYLNSVERATINPDGTIGAFSTVAGVTMAAARRSHTSAVIGNYLYVIGGTNGTYLNSMERATINADGTISPFSVVSGVNLATGRSSHTSAVIGTYLYVIGGTDASYLTSVERATINADGTLSTFATASGVTLATGRYVHTSVVIDNYLYVIGGSNGGSLNSVERAMLQ